MSKIADQHYLRSDQYRDSANLDARIVLHRRFSTNTYGWYRWCFDRFDLPPRADILELGCGPAYLWHEMIDRVQAEWAVILKTKASNWTRLQAEVRKIHSYKVPCMIRIKVEANKDYEDWLKDSC